MDSSIKINIGYYSIVQYVPSLERGEGANIGVVLFSPKPHFLKASMDQGNDRIRRFFSKDTRLDIDQLNVLKKSFEERLQGETESIHTREDFNHFIATRANQFQLTTPRAIKFENPENELDELYEALVDRSRT
jgi:hypothetical protein